MKSTKVKNTDKNDETLASELIALTATITATVITFTNAKGDKRECPLSVFSHTGRILVEREKDEANWILAKAVAAKVRDESDKADQILSVKAGRNIKAATLSTTIRTGGMKLADSPVTDQLKSGQDLLAAKRSIEAVQAERKLKAELAAQTAKTEVLSKDVADFLCGPSVKVA